MSRFVGIKNNAICIVADTPFIKEGVEVLEVPPELANLSSTDLILNCRIKDNKLRYRDLHKPAKEMKVALVSNWKMKCGIATYAENLWPEIAKQVGDFKLFIERQETYTGDIHQVGTQTVPEDQVIACWKRGTSPKNLITAIKEYDPDVVIFQHEFGLWPNAAYWMSMMTQLSEYRVIVIMHSIFPNHKDKTIVEACIPEIVVHLEAAKIALIGKGVSTSISVIPHGCYPHSEERFWNFYKTDHTVVQMGFGFRYKCFENTIIACSIIKNKYPDLFLTILFSESDQNKNEHQIYYQELCALINKLRLEENVAIIRGFQSDSSVNSYLRTNRVAVFPYQSDPVHLVYGASGAARLAMASNLPVISSSIPHFSDLPTIKCNSPEEISVELDKLFSSQNYYDAQLKRQVSFIKDNSWENIAQKFVKLLERADS